VGNIKGKIDFTEIGLVW